MDKYAGYEKDKQNLLRRPLTAAQYEREIKELAKKWKV